MSLFPTHQSAQYIGEICRYLLAQPPRETDSQHNVTLMFGNGLRPKIWNSFVKRFNVAQVGEFYGSTEGNTNVINTDNQEGSCGFVSLLFPSVYPVCLIKLDEETNQPIRDADGMCVHCKPGESGEFVGKIVQSDPTRSFDGYASKEATEKKIISNVFRKGDQAFLSGDLLTLDNFGYVYFKDRTGDTFRWKGENVSTAEVEAVISQAIEQLDCVVYGVEIKDCEGKAGMAALNVGNANLNLDELALKLNMSLPRYAIPVFLRIVDHLQMTGTFKMPKNDLQNEGYDHTRVADPLYYLDASKMRYVRIDDKVYQDLLNGNIKL
jgi:solute carrier family 27 fatty acid transporter 1/4